MERRTYTRLKCCTRICWNTGKLNLIGAWKHNGYCEYIKVLCPMCHAKYWMVKREGRYSLKDRGNNENFDHRLDDR